MVIWRLFRLYIIILDGDRGNKRWSSSGDEGDRQNDDSLHNIYLSCNFCFGWIVTHRKKTCKGNLLILVMKINCFGCMHFRLYTDSLLNLGGREVRMLILLHQALFKFQQLILLPIPHLFNFVSSWIRLAKLSQKFWKKLK